MKTRTLGHASLYTLSLATAALLAACSSVPPPPRAFSQDGLPQAVKVPPGNEVVLETVGTGDILYECRSRKDGTAAFDWGTVGPRATLVDRNGKEVGRYGGPPATWEHVDGSRVTGTQIAVAPSSATSIPYQLVKADPATGTGVMQGVTYIQRIQTKGGIPPVASRNCTDANAGAQERVYYQADYIFWRAAN